MPLSQALGGMRHAWRSPGEKRRLFPEALAAIPNLAVMRLRSEREVEEWLTNL
jgi:hypothetical protein